MQETLGYWIEGHSFQTEDEVVRIFDRHVREMSATLGDPEYVGVGPHRGYDGSPPSEAISADYAKAIRFAVWRWSTKQETALYLTASDADTWLTLTRISADGSNQKPDGRIGLLTRLRSWMAR